MKIEKLFSFMFYVLTYQDFISNFVLQIINNKKKKGKQNVTLGTCFFPNKLISTTFANNSRDMKNSCYSGYAIQNYIPIYDTIYIDRTNLREKSSVSFIQPQLQ